MLYVYTAITGDFVRLNQLRQPLQAQDPAGRQVRFVCFTDGLASAPSPWEIRSPLWEHKNDPRRTARWHKTHPHLCFPDAEYSLWLDGNQQLFCNPWSLVDDYLKSHDLASYKHPQRSCIYSELLACVRLKKDKPAVMQQQIDRYKKEKYPENNGLIETTVVLRRHTEAIRKLNEAWWNEISKGSRRDQLSLNYCLWKTHTPHVTIPGQRDKPVFFKYYAHR